MLYLSIIFLVLPVKNVLMNLLRMVKILNFIYLTVIRVDVQVIEFK
jgi:hypothetical protein